MRGEKNGHLELAIHFAQLAENDNNSARPGTINSKTTKNH
jgi:hypothetical protein